MNKEKKKKRNSKYTREFRDLSVQLVINSEESTAKIAKNLDTIVKLKRLQRRVTYFCTQPLHKER